MEYKSKEQEIKTVRNLAIAAVATMLAVFLVLVTYKQDSLRENFSITNIDILLMLAMLIPIGIILKLLCKKTKEVANLREQFYQSQKMEAIGRLAGGIAHDFNNILASSTGYAEFLVEDLAGVDPKLQNFAKQILTANKQAQKLVEQILSFSRKQDNIHLHDIDLKNSLTEILDLLRSRIKQGIELEEQISESKIIINGNNGLLHQLIMNLCVNAVDAMIPKKQGKLTVSCKTGYISEDIQDLISSECPISSPSAPLVNKLIVDGEKNYLINGGIDIKSEYAIVVIEDNGTGIEKDILKQIFDPFFTTKGVNKGTGLGLSSALNIINMHKGAIIIKTELGVGTKFIILLPLVEKIENNNNLNDINYTKIENKAINDNKYILLIEDDMSVAGTMEIMLNRMGHETLHCLNPLEALDLLDAGEKFDLIISDYKMPYMTGLEMAKKIYGKYPDLKIIMMTGFSDKKIGTRLGETSITRIIRKPAKSDEIKEAIEETLAK